MLGGLIIGATALAGPCSNCSMAESYNEIDLTLAKSRILALDLGKKRIGLAISDPLGITAQGLPSCAHQQAIRPGGASADGE